MMAKYFATSLAIEKVVSAPRVISSCLPISTTSISFVGSESRSTMLPASRALRAGLPGDTIVGLSERRRIVGTIASHCDQPTVRLLAADIAQLILRRCLSDEIINTGLRGDCSGGHRIVARDHHGLDAHAA